MYPVPVASVPEARVRAGRDCMKNIKSRKKEKKKRKKGRMKRIETVPETGAYT